MGRLLFFLFLLLLIVIGVGFYLQWWTVSFSGNDAGVHINLFVDKEKIKQTEEKIEEKFKNNKEKGREKAAE
jgi:hypothetical protein